MIGTVLRRVGWRRGLLFSVVLILLWGFVRLSVELHEAKSLVYDEPLLLRAQALSGPSLDRLFVGVTWAGYQGVMVFDVVLVLVLFFLRCWREAAFTGLAFAGSAFLNMGAKLFFRRERPSVWDSIAPEHTFSFPSGHAMGSMTLMLTLVLLCWRTRWRWLALLACSAFALAVAVSRVYLGVHYPSDILGGWIAGSAWVVGVYAAVFNGSQRPWKTSLAGYA